MPRPGWDDRNVPGFHEPLLMLGRDDPFALKDVEHLISGVHVRYRAGSRVKEDSDEFGLPSLLGPHQVLHVNGSREMGTVRRFCLLAIHFDYLHTTLSF